MTISSPYKSRAIRFLEIHEQDGWKIKIYSISAKSLTVNTKYVETAKQQLSQWLSKHNIYALATYNVATLILHEGKEGCFAIVNWWTDENMLQHYVFFASNENETGFKSFADNSIITCVWELEVLWFERNAWVEYVLQNPDNPDIKAYLHAFLNTTV